MITIIVYIYMYIDTYAIIINHMHTYVNICHMYAYPLAKRWRPVHVVVSNWPGQAPAWVVITTDASS